MGENGVVRFPGHLDPTAQEFRPTTIFHHLPPPPPPPQPNFQLPPHPFYPLSQEQLIYSLPQPHPPVYVGVGAPPPAAILPPSLPPPAQAPTRAVLLSSVPPNVSETGVRRELEVFGDVRAVQMERVREGIVTVHFYDLRAAHAALDSVRDQHMQHQHRLRNHYSSVFAPTLALEPLAPPPPPPPLPPPRAPGIVCGRAVWAQFAIPATNVFPDGHNQGTIVIFHLDPNVSASTLRQIFQAFGPVKELRETPMKRQQRFVEFYDIRDASRALAEMNGKEINGRSVMIEFSRPGGYCHKKQHYNLSSKFHHHHSPIKPLPPPPPPPPPQTPPFSARQQRRTSPRMRIISATNRRRRSPSSEEESVEAAMGGLALDHHHHPNHHQPEREYSSSSRKSSSGSSSVVSNNSSSRKGTNNNDNIPYNGNCSNLGSAVITSTSTTPTTKLQQNHRKGSGGGNCRPWKGRHQKNFDPRFMIKEEAIMVATDGGCSKDFRTTVMIKNIPNKYSQKLLLNMLDNHCIHCNEQISGVASDQPLSSYDFVYLPIDFNNKCNVGYGFVNMTSPEATLRLYKAFHHQHWEVFNSRKICEVTYARVQGLEALKEHFKNSKFACENDEYLPVVFAPPRDGRHLPAPLPIVLSSNLSTPSSSITLQQLRNHDDDQDVDGGGSTSSSISTVPSSSEFHHDCDNVTDGGGSSSGAASSDGGGDAVNVDVDDKSM